MRTTRFALRVGVNLLAAGAGYVLRPYVKFGNATETLEPDLVASEEKVTAARRAGAAGGPIQQEVGPAVEVHTLSQGSTHPGVADDVVVVDPATGRASLRADSKPGAAPQAATDDELVTLPDTGEVRLRQANQDLAFR